MSRPRTTLVAAALAYSLVTLGTTVVTVALPRIQGEFNSATSGLQWAVSSYTLVLASLLMTAGAVCDAVGARRLMLGGLALFGAGAVTAAAAPDLKVVVFGQILLGAGAAALTPASLSLITNAYPDRRQRAQAIGIWASAAAAAVAAGPVLGGLVISTFGWRAAFGIDIPIVLIVGALASRVAETPIRGLHRLDIPGQLCAIVCLASLTFALIESGNHAVVSVPVLAAAVLALSSGTAFVLVELRSEDPMLPLGLFRSRVFTAGSTIAMLVNFAFYGQLFVLSLYLQNTRGLSAPQTGLIFLAQPAAFALAASRTNRLVTRLGRRTLMMSGSIAATIGALALVPIGPTTPYALIIAGLILFGLGAAAVIPVVTTEIVSAAPRKQIGTAAAALNSIRILGAVLGIAMLGGHVSRNGTMSGVHVAMGASALALAFTALLTARFVARGDYPEHEQPETIEP